MNVGKLISGSSAFSKPTMYTPGHLPLRSGGLCSHRNLSTTVHYSFIHNSLKRENSLPVVERLNCGASDRATLLGNKKKFVEACNLAKSPESYAK